MTDDNRNDLVARDSAGTFWLYPGNGTGGFGARKQLTTFARLSAGLRFARSGCMTKAVQLGSYTAWWCWCAA